jgi:hypothetical protein
MQPAGPSAEAPAGPEAEMQIWFMKTQGRGITPAQARELIQSRNEGRFLTAVVELKAKL